ncbi:MAG: hypothetical protein LBB88_11190 [Planctomycetaceae bacterium]|jgi:hypothetical protein|nr:hypothetical protein [Planctomycetaceae bacterium]
MKRIFVTKMLFDNVCRILAAITCLLLISNIQTDQSVNNKSLSGAEISRSVIYPTKENSQFVIHPNKENYLEFKPTIAKFVKLNLSRDKTNWGPCIDELLVFGTKEPHKNLAASSNGSKAYASSCIDGYALHRICYLNDSNYGNNNSWIANQNDPSPYVIIELPSPETLNAIALSRDMFNNYNNGTPVNIEILLSNDGSNYTPANEIKLTHRPSLIHTHHPPVKFYETRLPPPPPSLAETQESNTKPFYLPQNWPVDNFGFKNLALNPKASIKTSSNQDQAKKMIDGKFRADDGMDTINDPTYNPSIGWNSNSPRSWVELDLGEIYSIYCVAFETLADALDEYEIFVATKHDDNIKSPVWKKVAPTDWFPPVDYRTEFHFTPTDARFVRLELGRRSFINSAAIDELEVFGRKEKIKPHELKLKNIHEQQRPKTIVNANKQIDEWKTSLVDEEFAWMKAFGFANIDPRKTRSYYPAKIHANRLPADYSTLVKPQPNSYNNLTLDGDLKESIWSNVSATSVYAAKPESFQKGAASKYVCRAFQSDDKLYVSIITNRLLSRCVMSIETASVKGAAYINDDNKFVWKEFTKNGESKNIPIEGGYKISTLDDGRNRTGIEFAIPLETLKDYEKGLAVYAGIGGKYTASGVRTYFYLDDVAIVPMRYNLLKLNLDNNNNVNNSQQNNSQQQINRPIFAVKLVNHSDKTIDVGNIDTTTAPVLSHDGKIAINSPFNRRQQDSESISIQPNSSVNLTIPADCGELGAQRLCLFDIAGRQYRVFLSHYDPLTRVMNQLDGIFVTINNRLSEQNEFSDQKLKSKILDFQSKNKWTQDYIIVTKNQPDEAENFTVESDNESFEPIDDEFSSPEYRERFLAARQLKREVFFADPELRHIGRILFEQRFPLNPSHNYSHYFDSIWGTGGGIYILNIPKEEGRFVPEKSTLKELFASTGMARQPAVNFDVSKIYFSNRRYPSDYWHILEMNLDGSDLRQITDGQFHDFWATPLPDGDLAFITTRCKQRFLCWEPQASVLYRMDKNGQNMKRLSFANLTEFAPSVSRDGRILWTRSEYLDKGADYGHTLWYIRPDGTSPELTFGNTVVLPQGYTNGREIPDSNEIIACMFGHHGDNNGPVTILDIDKGRLNAASITNLTPEIPWPGRPTFIETFREPYPVSRDYFLVSHSPRDRFALYLIDRFGNREMLYMNERYGSMCPIPLDYVQASAKPPVYNSSLNSELVKSNLGVFMVEDVYKGIDHVVPRGSAKYLRVAQEAPHFLEKYDNGMYRSHHINFTEFYASPTDLVRGPFGWTSYVVKGDLGIVELESDGSVVFYAPSDKVLFFELLDENYNEIQRMRSVVQLQAGESRSCVGCHEDRATSPGRNRTIASKMTPKQLMPSPWGVGVFDYQKTVQPVFDKNCVSCHSEQNPNKANLSGVLDKNFIPSSYRTLIRGGYVHHFNWSYTAQPPVKAEPYTFGSVKSKIWTILKDKNHTEVKLTPEEERAIKCWIDLSCPLWSDYTQRRLRGKNQK